MGGDDYLNWIQVADPVAEWSINMCHLFQLNISGRPLFPNCDVPSTYIKKLEQHYLARERGLFEIKLLSKIFSGAKLNRDEATRFDPAGPKSSPHKQIIEQLVE